MSQCNKCGSRTTNTRLCPQCSRDKYHGQRLDESEQEDESPEETMDVECADCGHVHTVGVSSRKTCPDCGYHGFRPVTAL